MNELRRPNILFVLADDLGYADLGCYGARHTRTPALDRLAAEGVRLTQAYANSPICTATRAALITGRYQHRFPVGLEEPIRSARATIGLAPETPTLPRMLQRLGYRTSLIGKWHLGAPPASGPLLSGYDRFFGFYGGALDYFRHSQTAPGQRARPHDGLFDGEVPVERDGYLTDILAEAAIAEVLAVPDGQPFFLSLHFNAPHWPWEGPRDGARSASLTSLRDEAGGSVETYGAMVEALDAAVGRVLATLAERGLERDTIVVFTSDNGGERYSDVWPLIGLKGELLEGGIRVPAIVRWPSRLPAGETCGQVAISMDWAPTLLAAASAGADGAEFDGADLLGPLAAGADFPRKLYWRYAANGQAAVRDGDWKYLRLNGREWLFDLGADPRERADLATRDPERLGQLRHDHAVWEGTMLAYPTDHPSETLKGRIADRY